MWYYEMIILWLQTRVTPTMSFTEKLILVSDLLCEFYFIPQIQNSYSTTIMTSYTTVKREKEENEKKGK